MTGEATAVSRDNACGLPGVHKHHHWRDSGDTWWCCSGEVTRADGSVPDTSPAHGEVPVIAIGLRLFADADGYTWLELAPDQLVCLDTPLLRAVGGKWRMVTPAAAVEVAGDLQLLQPAGIAEELAVLIRGVAGGEPLMCAVPGNCPLGPGHHPFAGPDRDMCCCRQPWEPREDNTNG